MLTLWAPTDKTFIDRVVGPVLKGMVPAPVHQVVRDDVVYRPVTGEVCLAMGSSTLEELQKAGLCPKNRKIGSLRGKVFPSTRGGKYLLSFDPAATVVDASKAEEIAWDIRLAERLVRTGSLSPEIGYYAYVDDLSGALAAVDILAQDQRSVPVAVDLETQGLYPWYQDRRILTIQVSVVEGASDVYRVPQGGLLPPKICNQLQSLLKDPRVSLRGSNLKFDLQWIVEKWGIECTNFRLDTVLVGSLLNENRSNSLKSHARVYTTMGGYEAEFEAKHDKEDMASALVTDPEGFLRYAGGDTDAALRVSNVLRRDLMKDPQLANFYVNLLHPAARAFEKIERRGLLVDQAKMAVLAEDLKAEIAGLEAKALALLPGRLRAKYSDNLSLGRPAVLQEFFFGPLGLNLKPYIVTEKSRAPSTAHHHLQMFSEVPEAKAMCDLLGTMSVAKKTLSTYVVGFLKHLRPDGRLHPTFFLAAQESEEGEDGGTVSGRLSATNPAIQTLPKKTKCAKRLRECYPAPPGHVILECLPGDTRVATTRGLVRIDQIVPGDSVVINEVVAPISVATRTGTGRDIFRVRTSSGKSLRATPNHRVLCVREGELSWVRVDGLVPGDCLVSPNSALESGSQMFHLLPYVAGLFYGDGHAQNGEKPTVCFALGLDAEDLLGPINFLFSPSLAHARGQKGDFAVTGNGIRWFIDRFKKNGSRDMRIPDEIWESDGVSRRSFLAGAFDSDGSAHSRRLTISSVCKAYIDDLALLAASVGVFGVVDEVFQVTNFAPDGVVSHRFHVFETESLALFPKGFLKRKLEIVAAFLSKTYTQCRVAQIPIEMLDRFNAAQAQSTPASNRLFSNGRRNGRITRDALRKAIASNHRLLPAAGLLDFRYDRVESVEPAGVSDVYDITVPGLQSFVADGFVVHNCDYSQGELKLIAIRANEKVMLAAYQNGLDLHCVTAGTVNGYSYEEFKALEKTNPELYDKLRSAAKPSNFGLTYGMGAEGFQEYAWKGYGVKMTIDEATKQRDGFFSTYPGLYPWHDKEKAFARQHGFVRNSFGRVRHLPLIWSKNSFVRSGAERQAVNSPIQSDLSDMMLLGVALLEQEYAGSDLQIICTTHDSLWAYCPEDDVSVWVPRIKDVLEDLPLEKLFGVRFPLTFNVDAKAGRTLASLAKV